MNLRSTAPLLVTALVLFGLAACDGGGEAPEETEGNGTSAPAESATPTNGSTENSGETAPESNGEAEEPAEEQTEEQTDSSSVNQEQAAAADNAGDQGTASNEPTQTAAAENGKAAAQALGCTACHAAETKLVGPPYKDVAERYGGDKAKILEVMKTSVKNGAQGNWTDVTGGVAMPPQPQAVGQDEQLEAVAEWVAGMAE